MKTIHQATMVNKEGQASALCYRKPRPIPATETYVMFKQEDAVTCPKCRKILDTKPNP
jgi:hypothetical protein